MLRIRIELVPHGIGEPRLLREIHIANDGSGDEQIGNYAARISKRGKPMDSTIPYQPKVVEGFLRQRYNELHLLKRVLNKLGGK